MCPIHLQPTTYVSTSTHRKLHLAVSPSYWYGFTDESGLELNCYVTDLWAASPVGGPFRYHTTGYYTEIWEHGDKGTWARGVGTWSPQQMCLETTSHPPRSRLIVPFGAIRAHPAYLLNAVLYYNVISAFSTVNCLSVRTVLFIVIPLVSNTLHDTWLCNNHRRKHYML